MLHLCDPLVRPHLKHYVFWSPCCMKEAREGAAKALEDVAGSEMLELVRETG